MAHFRITEKNGIKNRIPQLHGADFTQFLRSHSKSVVFFSNHSTIPDFAISGIIENQDKMGFVVGDLNEAPSEQCESKLVNAAGLCVVLFDRLRPCNFSQPEFIPSSFFSWTTQALHPNYYDISSGHELSWLFQSPQPVIFGVGFLSSDFISNPIDFQKYSLSNSTIIYCVSEHLISSAIQIKLSKGLYVYRSTDRQLVTLTQKSDFESPLTSMSFFDQSNNFSSSDIQKPYLVAAYFGNDHTYNFAQDEINILTQLSKSFSSKYLFSYINGKTAEYLVKQLNIEDQHMPFFIVFDRIQMKYRRWLDISIPTKDAYISSIHSPEYITKFLKNISNGMQPTILSQKEKKQDKNNFIRNIVGSNFRRTVFNDQIDAVVVFTEFYNEKSDQLNAIANAACHFINAHLSNSTIKFYWIDASRNDLPRNSPPLEDCPTIALYPAGRKSDFPYIYRIPERMKSFVNENAKESDVHQFIEFLKEKVTHSFSAQYKDTNSNQIQKDLNEFIERQKSLRDFFKHRR